MSNRRQALRRRQIMPFLLICLAGGAAALLQANSAGSICPQPTAGVGSGDRFLPLGPLALAPDASAAADTALAGSHPGAGPAPTPA